MYIYIDRHVYIMGIYTYIYIYICMCMIGVVSFKICILSMYNVYTHTYTGTLKYNHDVMSLCMYKLI